jgi:hypothetical protein
MMVLTTTLFVHRRQRKRQAIHQHHENPFGELPAFLHEIGGDDDGLIDHGNIERE